MHVTVDKALQDLVVAVRDKVRLDADHKIECEQFDESKRQVREASSRVFKAQTQLERAASLEMKSRA